MLSGEFQTSCLESYHAIVNQFCPKSVAYKPEGMYTRYELFRAPFKLSGKLLILWIRPPIKMLQADLLTLLHTDACIFLNSWLICKIQSLPESL